MAKISKAIEQARNAAKKNPVMEFEVDRLVSGAFRIELDTQDETLILWVLKAVHDRVVQLYKDAKAVYDNKSNSTEDRAHAFVVCEQLEHLREDILEYLQPNPDPTKKGQFTLNLGGVALYNPGIGKFLALKAPHIKSFFQESPKDGEKPHDEDDEPELAQIK